MRHGKSFKAIIFAVLLSGCTHVQMSPVIEQEALLQQCSFDTPIPTDTTGKALMTALIDYQHLYSECAQRNDALIKIIKGLRDHDKEIRFKI